MTSANTRDGDRGSDYNIYSIIYNSYILGDCIYNPILTRLLPVRIKILVFLLAYPGTCTGNCRIFTQQNMTNRM